MPDLGKQTPDIVGIMIPYAIRPQRYELFPYLQDFPREFPHLRNCAILSVKTAHLRMTAITKHPVSVNRAFLRMAATTSKRGKTFRFFLYRIGVRWHYRLSNFHEWFPQVCWVREMVKRKSRGLKAYLTVRFSHYPMILPISRLISNHILLAPTNTHTHPHSDKSWHA